MTDTRLSGVRRHICRADKRRFLQQRQTGRRIFFMNTHRPVFYALSSLHERIYGNTEIMIFIKPVSKGTHSKKTEAVSEITRTQPPAMLKCHLPILFYNGIGS